MQMPTKTDNSAQHKAWSAFLEKIQAFLDNGETYESIAKMVGTSKNVVWEWMNKGKGGKRVSYDSMCRYLRGVGLFPADYFGQDDSVDWIPPAIGSVPLTELASCGQEQWFSKTQMQMRAPRPGDQWNNPDLFAVIAIGDSLKPLGIESGMICYCDPRTALDEGDVAFIERKDGFVTLKRYAGIKEGEHVYYEGWLDPDENGQQTPWTQITRLSEIQRIVPVIYIRRKL